MTTTVVQGSSYPTGKVEGVHFIEQGYDDGDSIKPKTGRDDPKFEGLPMPRTKKRK